MISVLMADDHAMVRAGFKQIFAETPDIRMTGEAGNASEVFALLRENGYDVVILDIEMPGRNGIEILKQIKYTEPELPVLVLSMYSEDQYALRAFKAGAVGYLTKNSAVTELIRAIRVVMRGEKYITPAVAVQFADELGKKKVLLKHEKLSDRELQVMCMIASGKSLKEIAEELHLSVNTIATHRQRVLKKMNMKSNVELTHYALREGLL